jgi:dUTP pyrophosphatase
MYNTSDENITIFKGDKIAQMVLSEVPMIKWNEVESLDETERGEGGFGSTGV